MLGTHMTEQDTSASANNNNPKNHDANELDQQLLVKIQAGDKLALAQLYDRHADLMLGLAYRILQQRDDAEDLLHDVFLEVWQQAKQYDPERGSVSTWLLLRLRSRAIDRLRTLALARERALAKAAEQTPIPSDASIDPSVASEHARTKQAVDGLSEVQRTVVQLGYFEGLTCAEIATRCNIPIGTVKSRLAAALSQLRLIFDTEKEARHAR